MTDVLKGPQFKRITAAYQWKAEMIVRWFRDLGMTEEQKVKYLAEQFAQVAMYHALHGDQGISELLNKK